MQSYFSDKPFSFSAIFISLSLIIYPATVLLVPMVNGLILVLFALIGLVYLFLHRRASMQASKNEAALYFSVSLFFATSLLITVISGFEYKAIGKYLHLVLVIPIYIYLRHSGVKLFYIWYGLVIGAVVASGVAIYEVVFLNQSRARSLTHPIIFGNLALVMGCMSLASMGWFKQRSNWQVILPVLAALCGVLASLLSGSRGGWIALPFIMLVFFLYIKSRFSIKQVVISMVLSITAMGVVYVVPQTQVKFQVDRTLTSLQQYAGSDIQSINRTTSVGARLEMWQASWRIFRDNPFIGVGWGHYKKQAQQQVDDGIRNKMAAEYDHPHSEYFATLASAGIIGIIVLLILFLTPIWLFIQFIKHGKVADSKRLALAGLVLIVAYIVFGISESMLMRSRSVNFFTFYLAVIMAAIYTQENKTVTIN